MSDLRDLGTWVQDEAGSCPRPILEGWIPASEYEQAEAVEPAVLTAIPVIGAHGGSGATTVAGFLAAGDLSQPPLVAYDAGSSVPELVAGPAVVVTALGTAAGLAAAQRQVAAVQGAHRLPVVVVVTSDGQWHLPPVAKARLRALSGRVDAVVVLPYVSRWRFVDVPDDPPRRYRNQLEKVRAALGGAAQDHLVSPLPHRRPDTEEIPK